MKILIATVLTLAVTSAGTPLSAQEQDPNADQQLQQQQQDIQQQLDQQRQEAQQQADEQRRQQEQQQQEQQQQDQQQQQQTQQQGQQQPTASQLMNKQVYDSSGNELGTVKNVSVKQEDGKVKHIVIGIGGFLGMGEKNVLVPWERVQMRQDRIVINADRNRLENAPEGSVNDENWKRQSYQYWGVQYQK